MQHQEYNLRALQLEQLTILDELKRVCEKNNLTFYLACGTCIGAIRHKGFIPWDDDIDVFMHVKDYDILMRLKDEFGTDYFLQNTDTDPEYKLAIARVRKNGTACVEKDEMNIDCNHGIYIDIYPIYRIPDNFFKKYYVVYASIIYRVLLSNNIPKNHGRFVRIIGKVILTCFNRSKGLKKYSQILRKYEDTKFVGVLYGMDVKIGKVILYRSDWFRKPQYVEFEGRLMPVSSNPILYLQQRYGKNVMEFPPEEKRRSYHQYVYVSFDKEYIANKR